MIYYMMIIFHDYIPYHTIVFTISIAVQIFHYISQVILLSSLSVSPYPGQIRSPSARVSSAAGKNWPLCTRHRDSHCEKNQKLILYIVTVYVSQ